jgi:hypothetical protein
LSIEEEKQVEHFCIFPIFCLFKISLHGVLEFRGYREGRVEKGQVGTGKQQRKGR